LADWKERGSGGEAEEGGEGGGNAKRDRADPRGRLDQRRGIVKEKPGAKKGGGAFTD